MERSLRTDDLFLLFGQLTSATLINNLSDIHVQTRSIESMLSSLNRLVPAEVSCQTSNMYFLRESLRDVHRVQSLLNLNRFLFCNRNSSIFQTKPPHNVTHISSKSGHDSYSPLNLSNLITSALIATKIITRRLSASATLFSTPTLCFRTNV